MVAPALRKGELPEARRRMAALRAHGCPLDSLMGWNPTEADRERLGRAYNRIQVWQLKPTVELYEQAIAALSGDGAPWPSLRLMAEVFLAGKRSPRPARHSPPPVKIPVERASEVGVPDPRKFIRDVDQVTIYLDESYFGVREQAERGVLGGIVWQGDVNKNVLPATRNHLQDSAWDVEAVQATFNNLLRSPRAIPFVASFFMPGEVAQRRYIELVVDTLKILLGWILDGRGRKVRVRIVLEENGGLAVGREKTEYFAGVFKEAAQFNPERFQAWTLESVTWQSKEFEYVPYADLMARLVTRTGRHRIAEWSRYTALPGYMPLTPGLVQLLQRLDVIERSKDVAALYRIATDLQGTWLLSAIIREMEERLRDRPDIQAELLEGLDRMYRAKDRNVPQLTRLFNTLAPLLSGAQTASTPRTRLLRSMLELEEANHRGDPESVRLAVEAYRESRREGFRTDPALACLRECMLAVHYADRFEFDEAGDILSAIVTGEAFREWLDERTRGIVLSNLGQAMSMVGCHDEAEQLFAQALGEFARAPISEDERRDECAQTGTYRAINALDGGLWNAIDLVQQVTGRLEEACVHLRGSGAVAESWKHHLFLRALCLLTDLPGETRIQACRELYLAGRAEWQTLAWHPWELIEAYRGLLLAGSGDKSLSGESAQRFVSGLLIALAEGHGAVLALIGAAIGAAGLSCWKSEDLAELAAKGLVKAEPMRRSKTGAAKLDYVADILRNPQRYPPLAALQCLPFNYH